MTKDSGDGIIDLIAEAESIRDAMCRWTKADYTILPPNPRYPHSSDSAKWYVVATEYSQARLTAHARTVWEDNAGTIWVESFQLGDTVDWIEQDYGEEGLDESDYLDLTEFSKPEVREEFGDHFPLVYAYLLGYEMILAEVSARRDVQLQMRYLGDVGVATFYMDARIEYANLDLRSKLGKVRSNVQALKAALNDIKRFEMQMAKKLGEMRPPVIGR